MSKGSTIVPVRMDQDSIELLDRIIAELNGRRRDAPFDRSSFIRKAIEEKIKHVWRSRRNGPFLTVGPERAGGDE